MNQFGRYQILDQLDSGGMGIIYRAYDPRFKREVAIKVMVSYFSHDPQWRQRFEREAQVVASLQHPAIVPVYDFGEENGQPYLVMALILGGSLADHLQQHGPLAPSEAVYLLTHLAPGLELAHQKGIAHRDLKPNNILFDQQGNPYITDFGIAKLFNATTVSAEQTGQVIGTPLYMSPEQARGALVDGRSDIYSLGVILFEVLTGQRPYNADMPVGLIYKHIHEPIPNILAIKPDLPSGCQEVIARAMAKNPSERYATPSKMAAALSAVVKSSGLDSEYKLNKKNQSLFGHATIVLDSLDSKPDVFPSSPADGEGDKSQAVSWSDLLGGPAPWEQIDSEGDKSQRVSWQDILGSPPPWVPASGEEGESTTPQHRPSAGDQRRPRHHEPHHDANSRTSDHHQQSATGARDCRRRPT